jgi:hypothetical protein
MICRQYKFEVSLLDFRGWFGVFGEDNYSFVFGLAFEYTKGIRIDQFEVKDSER